MKRTLLTASIAALALSIGGASYAQMSPTPTQPKPQDRTMNGSLPGSELNRDGNAQMGSGTMGGTGTMGGSGSYRGAVNDRGPGSYEEPPIGNRAGLAPADRVQHDRFGNVVTGNTCAQHWSNCAYDPEKGGTPNPQLGFVPGTGGSDQY